MNYIKTKIPFWSNSVLKATDLALRFNLKCLIGDGILPKLFVKAFRFKNKLSIGNMDFGSCFFTKRKNTKGKFKKFINFKSNSYFVF